MTSDDAEYYRGRVAVERDMARQAANPYARRAHEQLADNYEILCRLLRAKPPRPARPQPIIERVEFITLMQTLATPNSTYLVPAHGWPLHALPEAAPSAEPNHPDRIAAALDVSPAINEPSPAYPISPVITAA